MLFLQPQIGEVSEWLKEHAWKVCILERVSRVRIPPSPPIHQMSRDSGLFYNLFAKSGGNKEESERSEQPFYELNKPSPGLAQIIPHIPDARRTCPRWQMVTKKAKEESERVIDVLAIPSQGTATLISESD
jgi:hypothetical protein